MNIIKTISLPNYSIQEGVTTDGTFLYVSVHDTDQILKLDMQGNIVSTSVSAEMHVGGMCHKDGYLYVTVSTCPSSGTSANQFIYKYDTETLTKQAQYDLSSQFTICAGAICTDGTYFYIAESYYNNTTPDLVKKFDMTFNYISTLNVGDPNNPCPYGIQGIEWLPSLQVLEITSHATYYYRTPIDGSSIKKYNASFNLQDLTVFGNTIVYNNRDSKTLVFADINEDAPYTKNSNNNSLPPTIPEINPASIPKGCVLFYDMQDQGNKLIDKSGNGNHGLLISGVSNKSGLYGNLKHTDGVSSYINIPYAPSTHPPYLTIISFVKNANWQTTTDSRIISCTQAGGWYIAINDAGIGAGYFGTILHRNGEYGIVRVPTSSISSGLHMIALTFDGRYLKLYCDCTLLSMDDAGNNYTIDYSNNNSIFMSAEPMAGNTPDTPPRYTQNDFGNTMIFNRALSLAELKDIFNQYGPQYGIGGSY